MNVKKVSKPALEGDTYLVAQAVNHNAEVLEKVLNRIKELEKSMTKEEIEEFVQSEDMTREEIIALVRVAFAKWENWESDGKDDWSRKHNARDAAIKALEQEPIKDAYIKQVAKERDIAIEQLNELGYSWGEKIEPCKKDEVIAEIDRQGEWLAEAGYSAYNVDIAFGSIIRALRKWLR